MKYLYIIILLMMIGYTLLHLYFEYRLDKRIKDYEKRKNTRSPKKGAR